MQWLVTSHDILRDSTPSSEPSPGKPFPLHQIDDVSEPSNTGLPHTPSLTHHPRLLSGGQTDRWSTYALTSSVHSLCVFDLRTGDPPITDGSITVIKKLTFNGERNKVIQTWAKIKFHFFPFLCHRHKRLERKGLYQHWSEHVNKS